MMGSAESIELGFVTFEVADVEGSCRCGAWLVVDGAGAAAVLADRETVQELDHRMDDRLFRCLHN